MIAVDIFIDTNILIYAHDLEAGEKHDKALQLVRDFWQRREIPSLSIQVLQEMHVNLVRKGVSVNESVDTVRRYFAWRVISNTKALLRRAFDVQQRWQLSFWDAAVVAAAQQAGARIMWSEDFNAGEDYGGVVAVNPLH
ncbi:MAG: PIN domain-containing protein [bacterium]|nr:PIN domain-containing protein [bacterium]